VAISGLAGGEEAGLTAGTCGDIKLNAAASNAVSKGVKNSATGTSLDIPTDNLATGNYKTCVVRPGTGCGAAGDFNSATVAGATLSVVMPVVSPIAIVQGTDTTFKLSTALAGDIVTFSATKDDCSDTNSDKVTLTENGQVTAGKNFGTGPIYVCFATKEVPSAFGKAATVTAFAKSLSVDFRLVLTDANGKEVKLADVSVAAWYQEWLKEVTTDFCSSVGMPAGSCSITKVAQGSIIFTFEVAGTDALLTAAEAKLKDPAVLKSLAEKMAADASTLDASSSYNGAGTATSSSGGSTPPVKPTTTTGTTTGTVVVEGAADLMPTAFVGMVMALLMLKLN